MKKAQLALEFLLIITIALVIIGPIYFFTFQTSSDDIKVSKAQTTVEIIGKGIDYVYSINKGSVITVSVDLPGGISSYNVTNKTIVYKVMLSSGNTSVFYTTRATLNGTLPVSEGRHTINLSNTGGGVTIA
jgi:uncharacterized protein (UPF0333 family)